MRRLRAKVRDVERKSIGRRVTYSTDRVVAAETPVRAVTKITDFYRYVFKLKHFACGESTYVWSALEFILYRQIVRYYEKIE